MWELVGVVFAGLFAVISIMTTVGLALLRDRSEKRDLVYGTWYKYSWMIGKPISTREPQLVVMQAITSLLMVGLFSWMIWARFDQKPIVFILAFVICTIQVVVVLSLRMNYIKADDTRQLRLRQRHYAGTRDYSGEHPQPVRLRLPQD